MSHLPTRSEQARQPKSRCGLGCKPEPIALKRFAFNLRHQVKGKNAHDVYMLRECSSVKAAMSPGTFTLSDTSLSTSSRTRFLASVGR